MRSIEVGQRIRSWDFEPIEGRDNRYVEGKVVEIEDNLVSILVDFDSVKWKKDPIGRVGLITNTPLEIYGFDYESRLEVLS